MDNSVLVAIITASASIVGASAIFLLTKRHEIKSNWQKEKLNYYKVLFTAMSDLAVDGTDKEEANMRFCHAVNVIGLFAPQEVITALMSFHDAIKPTSNNKDKHDELLIKLLLAVRKDLDLTSKDLASTFQFHLIGSKPKTNIKS